MRPTPTGDIIHAIREILLERPAASYRDLTDRVTDYWGRPHKVYQIKNALAQLRKTTPVDPTMYGFYVPHAQRSRNRNNNPRFIILLVDRHGNHFTVDDERPIILRKGNLETLATTVQQWTNQAPVLELAALYSNSPAEKRHFRRMARFMSYMADETRDVVEEEKADLEAA